MGYWSNHGNEFSEGEDIDNCAAGCEIVSCVGFSYFYPDKHCYHYEDFVSVLNHNEAIACIKQPGNETLLISSNYKILNNGGAKG